VRGLLLIAPPLHIVVVGVSCALFGNEVARGDEKMECVENSLEWVGEMCMK